jgi:hypothetical protein
MYLKNCNNRNEEHLLNQDGSSVRSGRQLLENVRISMTAAPPKAITKSTKSGKPKDNVNRGKRVKRIRI